MSVLLLCYGDARARDMLKAAIQARYGINPPAIESLTVQFNGRAKTQIGPMLTWVPLESTARFVFPTHLRWDITVKPLRLPIQRLTEAFDGQYYRNMRRGQAPEIIRDEATITSMRRRLWAMAALMLTPLSNEFVKVSSVGERCINVEHAKLNDSVLLYFREDYTIDFVTTNCVNPDSGQVETLRIIADEQQSNLNDFRLPSKITYYWNAEKYLEMEPYSADLNPLFSAKTFTLVHTAGV